MPGLLDKKTFRDNTESSSGEGHPGPAPRLPGEAPLKGPRPQCSARPQGQTLPGQGHYHMATQRQIAVIRSRQSGQSLKNQGRNGQRSHKTNADRPRLHGHMTTTKVGHFILKTTQNKGTHSSRCRYSCVSDLRILVHGRTCSILTLRISVHGRT